MIVLGITGPSGSGKSSLLRELFLSGATIIDCDRIVRELQTAGTRCYEDIVAEFGTVVEDHENQRIDRSILGPIVFSDAKKLVKLNAITHHYVLEHINRLILEHEQKGTKVIVVEAGAYFESGMDRICDLTVYLTAPRHILIQRICSRDQISARAAEDRLNAQFDSSEAIRRSDIVLLNDGDPALLRLYSQLILSKAHDWMKSKQGV